MRTWPALKISFDGAPDLLQAALADYDVAAIAEPGETTWQVFFASASERDSATAGLPQQVPGLTIEPLDVPDEDWAARSQASIRAIQIRRIIVSPPWDLPPEGGSDIENVASANVASSFSRKITIIIQPSMGFGTGHHATTRLCLTALQEIDLRGRTALDAGTGSGILAIAASLLGAAQAVAIDDDPDAIQAARENLALNPAARVTIQQADLRSALLQSHDVVTANLTGALLIQAARRLHDHTAPSGRLILSGFMISEAAAVRSAFDDLAIEARAEEDEWVCFTLHKPA
jgi:ribosomal protein L11 methyltransferase